MRSTSRLAFFSTSGRTVVATSPTIPATSNSSGEQFGLPRLYLGRVEDVVDPGQ